VEFEDIFGGGDLDYNDVRLQVRGDIDIVQTPEPSALTLFAMGVPLLSLLRRTQRDSERV